jgi:glycosyltransferase involved in cell wall biosynthesis
MKPLDVVHFCRRPAPGAFSIERVFDDVRKAMPDTIAVTTHQNMYLSQGVLPRLRDAWAARRAARQINHVVGDVHYLTYFLPRGRTVLTVCDTILVDRARGIKRALLWFFWFWLPLRHCRWATAISEESRRRILELVSIPPERVTVIPCPVSASFTPELPGPREGPFRLLQIGTKSNKNLERLTVALKGLDVELTVVGALTGAQQALIAANVPHHRLLQGLDDASLRAEYARAEALVFVSLDEGFGLPILEAQATGRPVLTSNRAPMKEVAGDAALLVDPEDTDAIARAVTHLALDAGMRQRLTEKGFRNAARYSAQSIAQGYAALYEAIAREIGDV